MQLFNLLSLHQAFVCWFFSSLWHIHLHVSVNEWHHRVIWLIVYGILCAVQWFTTSLSSMGYQDNTTDSLPTSDIHAGTVHRHNPTLLVWDSLSLPSGRELKESYPVLILTGRLMHCSGHRAWHLPFVQAQKSLAWSTSTHKPINCT